MARKRVVLKGAAAGGANLSGLKIRASKRKVTGSKSSDVAGVEVPTQAETSGRVYTKQQLAATLKTGPAGTADAAGHSTVKRRVTKRKVVRLSK